MKALILNRQGKLPEDGFYHLEPSGRHFNRAANVTQVIDAKAVESIVKNFEPGETGMLIDQEHFSHNAQKSTEAFGWLHEVKNRDGELYGRIEWTDIGSPAVLNKRLRLFSTEYDPEGVEVIKKGEIRPLRLAGLTLTNRPNNLGGKPIANRAGEDLKKISSKENEKMKTVIAELGLDEGASEEAVLDAIKKLKSDKAALMQEGEAIKNREADALLKTHAAKIGEDEANQKYWHGQLVMNRAGAEAALIALPSPAKEKKPDVVPIHNRANAKTPDGVAGQMTNEQRTAQQRSAVDLIKNRDKCNFDQAFSRAQAENPGLFNG